MRAVALIVCVGLVVASCCKLKNGEKVADHLEAFAIVDTDLRAECTSECCCVLPNDSVIHNVREGEDISFWVRIVHFDNLRKGFSGRQATIQVVDADGRQITNDSVVVNPNVLMTGSDGLSLTSAHTKIFNPGIYRLKVLYQDRSTVAYSYSPNILVSVGVDSEGQQFQSVDPNAPLRFYFNYDVADRHDMAQIGPHFWVEKTSNDERYYFGNVTRDIVDGNAGTVVQKDSHDLYLFIPDKNATGTYATWLRMSTKRNGPWKYFQQMLGIQ